MFADPGQRVTAVGAWTIAFTGGAVVGALLLALFVVRRRRIAHPWEHVLKRQCC